MDKKNLPKILNDYKVWLDNQNKSEKTISSYVTDLTLLFDYLKINNVSDDTFKSITLIDLNGFINYSKNARKNSSSTLARKVASIQSLFMFLKKNKIIQENVALDLETPKFERKEAECPSVQEVGALLDAVTGNNSIRDTCIITLFANCGLRRSELVSLNLDQINDNTLVIMGKKKKTRKVFLNALCRETIEDYVKARPNVKPDEFGNPLFVSERLQRINGRTVYDVVKRHLGSAGLDTSKYHPHSLRHYAATDMYANGTDLMKIQKLLGHEQLETTTIYAHTNDKQLQDAVESNSLNARAKVNQIKETNMAVGE